MMTVVATASCELVEMRQDQEKLKCANLIEPDLDGLNGRLAHPTSSKCNRAGVPGRGLQVFRACWHAGPFSRSVFGTMLRFRHRGLARHIAENGEPQDPIRHSTAGAK